MQPTHFNGKYLGGLFRGVRQDGNKTDTNNNPVMVLLIQTEQVKEVLGLEQKSTVIEKVRVGHYLVEKGALNDFADYLDLEILLPITERDWEVKGRQGDMMRGVTMTLGNEYKTFLSLTNSKPVPGAPKKEPF